MLSRRLRSNLCFCQVMSRSHSARTFCRMTPCVVYACSKAFGTEVQTVNSAMHVSIWFRIESVNCMKVALSGYDLNLNMSAKLLTTRSLIGWHLNDSGRAASFRRAGSARASLKASATVQAPSLDSGVKSQWKLMDSFDAYELRVLVSPFECVASAPALCPAGPEVNEALNVVIIDSFSSVLSALNLNSKTATPPYVISETKCVGHITAFFGAWYERVPRSNHGFICITCEVLLHVTVSRNSLEPVTSSNSEPEVPPTSNNPAFTESIASESRKCERIRSSVDVSSVNETLSVLVCVAFSFTTSRSHSEAPGRPSYRAASQSWPSSTVLPRAGLSITFSSVPFVTSPALGAAAAPKAECFAQSSGLDSGCAAMVDDRVHARPMKYRYCSF
eukprot:Rhum_TRINITY_DN16478_c0_g1::Rhum_TRINITY_DN16478_c0_g1_i1::g.163301::m.163301